MLNAVNIKRSHSTNKENVGQLLYTNSYDTSEA